MPPPPIALDKSGASKCVDAMRPLMQRLARAGQRGITASITHKPWNGQTYDYFENMITEIKRADGTWAYDYRSEEHTSELQSRE